MKNTMEPKHNLKISKEKLSAFSKYDKKRDSGYLTDCSPASTNSPLQFNFDEGSISEEQEQFPLETGEISDDCFEDEDITEGIDKEVACAMSLERNICAPIPVSRPSAPLPSLNIGEYEGCISDPEVFTSYSVQRICRRNNSRCYFRPISRRTISTQTPHQNSQIIQNCVNTLSDRFHPYDVPIARGNVHHRLRHNSDDQVPLSPLPDVIPGRDRSISLPDVPISREAREAEVGRELRRISDEFHFSYHSPRQARILIQRQPGSFPGTWRFGAFWESLRQIFTPSPSDEHH